eukprot:TRINITY_DN5822_c0_g1_i4.p1 TRINITY_DN5822_c0_g1~~TRINITY_DN5822_c0_g1_i4.p1  ORF type:complete len:1087 (-),score=190.88 TRINITY_DN5822_c0_g1_i4:101-2938(-)
MSQATPPRRRSTAALPSAPQASPSEAVGIAELVEVPISPQERSLPTLAPAPSPRARTSALVPSPRVTPSALTPMPMPALAPVVAPTAPPWASASLHDDDRGFRLKTALQALRHEREPIATAAGAQGNDWPGCRCISLGDLGNSTKFPFDGQMVVYPPSVGSSCRAWDAGIHPACRGPANMEWCSKPWCFVDPCKCKLPLDVATIFPQLVRNGNTPVTAFFSYMACETFHVQGSHTAMYGHSACSNRKTPKSCGDVLKCIWVASRRACVAIDVAEACNFTAPQQPTARAEPRAFVGGQGPQQPTAGAEPREFVGGQGPQQPTAGAEPREFVGGQGPQQPTAGAEPREFVGGQVGSTQLPQPAIRTTQGSIAAPPAIVATPAKPNDQAVGSTELPVPAVQTAPKVVAAQAVPEVPVPSVQPASKVVAAQAAQEAPLPVQPPTAPSLFTNVSRIAARKYKGASATQLPEAAVQTAQKAVAAESGSAALVPSQAPTMTPALAGIVLAASRELQAATPDLHEPLVQTTPKAVVVQPDATVLSAPSVSTSASFLADGNLTTGTEFKDTALTSQEYTASAGVALAVVTSNTTATTLPVEPAALAAAPTRVSAPPEASGPATTAMVAAKPTLDVQAVVAPSNSQDLLERFRAIRQRLAVNLHKAADPGQPFVTPVGAQPSVATPGLSASEQAAATEVTLRNDESLRKDGTGGEPPPSVCGGGVDTAGGTTQRACLATQEKEAAVIEEPPPLPPAGCVDIAGGCSKKQTKAPIQAALNGTPFSTAALHMSSADPLQGERVSSAESATLPEVAVPPAQSINPAALTLPPPEDPSVRNDATRRGSVAQQQRPAEGTAYPVLTAQMGISSVVSAAQLAQGLVAKSPPISATLDLSPHSATLLEKGKTQKWPAGETQDLFQRIDHNGDNHVSPEEVSAFLASGDHLWEGQLGVTDLAM